MLQIGDVFVTRNAKEEDNGSPGFWNHVAIYTKIGVVEGQSKPWDCIICTPLEEFVNRYPTIKVFRLKESMIEGKEDLADKAADTAMYYVGKPYRKLGSLFPRLSRGNNCVSVVRKAYWNTIQHDPGWVKPDHVTEDKGFTEVFSDKEALQKSLAESV